MTVTVPDTSELMDTYYDRLAERRGWEELLSDGIRFTGPNTQTEGKAAFILANNRFLQAVRSFEVKQQLTDGKTGCAWLTYQLESPKGARTELDVLEIWHAANGKLDQMTIYFDTAAFRSFLQS
jgi:hypothetical protein